MRLAVPLAVITGGVIAWFALREPPEMPRVLDEEQSVQLPQVAAPQSIDELRARIGRVLEREGVPGVGIALVGRDGPIWIGGVGVADEITRTPVDGDTVFRVGSITKSVVALGVMRLVEQGKLDLDRPLRDYIPDAGITNPWEDVAPVTLAQVLEHTAGLDDMHFNEFFTDDDTLPASAALAINSRSREIRWRPGTRHSYANPGYTLAARAIEVATGERFDVWLRRELLVPLGMRDADFSRTAALAPRLATGYHGRNHPVAYRTFAHRGAGALLASPRDLAKLVEWSLRRDGSIVSPRGLDRIEHTRTLPYPATDVQYGLGNYGDVDHPVRSRGHDGGLPGFLSSLRYFPELGTGYVMLLDATHSFHAYIEIRALLYAYLARGREVAVESGTAAPPTANAYMFANPRHSLIGFIERACFGWRVEVDYGGVQLEPLFGDKFDLIATRDGGYRAWWQSGSSVRFADNHGTPVMTAGFVYAEAAAWAPARLRYIALRVAVWLLGIVAPMWALFMLGYARGRGGMTAFKLALWPAIAGVCLVAFPQIANAAGERGVLGEVHPLTIALCATTIVFAVASIAAVVATMRASFREHRLPLTIRVPIMAETIAAFALTVWFGAHGFIGLRTWAW
jgi:CubicO group peptidase (beta-lactamase class C family)